MFSLNKTVSAYEFLALGVLALLSFLLYGLPFGPVLNSDVAVHVYMTDSFSLRDNLYFWHQDRLGSIVPLVGWVILNLFDIPAVWACGVSEYLFLLIACLTFWMFIERPFFRFLFAALMLFPAFEMLYVLMPAHPYGEQMAMLGLSFVLLKTTLDKQSLLYLPAFFTFCLLAIWVSDFSLFYVSLLVVVFMKPLFSLIQNSSRKSVFMSSLLSASVILVGVVVLYYAKHHTLKDETYVSRLFSSGSEFSETLYLLWFYVKAVVSFSSISWFNSLLFYSLVGACIYASALIIKEKFTLWTKFFLLAAGSSFLVLISLRWVAENYVMIKYFIPSILFLWIGLLSILSKTRPAYNFFLSLSIIGCIGSGISISYFSDENTNLSLNDLNGIKTIQSTGLIGDYWHSYLYGITNPEMITATPHEGAFARSNDLKIRTMERDTFYLFKDGWFESYPDEIEQYGVELKRVGLDKEIAGSSCSAYIKK